MMRSSARTESIPIGRWSTFFESFSKEHDGSLIRLEQRKPSGEIEVMARDVALLGISATADRDDALDVTTASKAGERLKHAIERPKAVRFQVREDEAALGLEIESDSGAVTTLKFITPQGVD